MSDILVVGLAGSADGQALRDALHGRRVFARTCASLQAIDVIRDYSDLFDGDDLRSIPDRIAAEVSRANEAGPVAYLVPGWASIGDATVEALAKQTTLQISTGTVRSAHARSGVTVIDALSLAIAQSSAPFQAGTAPLDASQPVIITNWYGTAVTRLALEYLHAVYGTAIAIQPDGDGVVEIEGQDLLSGGTSLAALRYIYARLRRPDGCPWDREQTELSTVPHIVEEATELREALDDQDWPHAADELGDILGNVLMIAQIAEECGRFTFSDAVSALSAKLVRRHPHVFGDMQAATPEEVLGIWNQVKQQERTQQQHPDGEE